MVITAGTGSGKTEAFFLPVVDALVNPNRLDDLSGLNYLAAAGVVFMTVVAVNRELRRREIAEVPACRGSVIRGNHPDTKESDLESVPMPALGLEMPGVVPPFRPIFVVRPVIARKLKVVARKRRGKIHLLNVNRGVTCR